MSAPQSIPHRLAIFPLSAPLFPGQPLSLHLFEPRYRRLVRDRLHDDPIFGVVMTTEGMEVNDRPRTARLGTAASLGWSHELPDGRWLIEVVGTRLFELISHDWNSDYMVGSIHWLDRDDDSFSLEPWVRRRYVDAFAAYLRCASVAGSSITTPVADVIAALDALLPTRLDHFAFSLASLLPLNTWEKQAVLEQRDGQALLDHVLGLVRREQRMARRTGATGVDGQHPAGDVVLN